MFNRVSYKKIAKDQLRGRWAPAVFVSLVICLIFCIISLPEYLKDLLNDLSLENMKDNFNLEQFQNGFSFNYTSPVVVSDSSFSFLRFIISSFIYGASFLSLVMFFNSMFLTTQIVKFSSFIDNFAHCIKGFLAYLWFTLWTFLWSCLFFIPGIVKAFSYSQMFFIMAENPKISCFKAMNISKIITKGYKGDLFAMLLSFLLWDILSIFTFGILQLWIIPYKMMSFTNAYYAIKSQAIKQGLITEEDFN
jgi:uncharacterized membrane protein